MEHYERNDSVSAELKEWQIGQITILLGQINAPQCKRVPTGDVELMQRYFERFHAMLVGYSQQTNLAQRQTD